MFDLREVTGGALRGRQMTFGGTYLWYSRQGLFEVVVVVCLVGGVLHLDHVKVLKCMDAWIHKVLDL